MYYIDYKTSFGLRDTKAYRDFMDSPVLTRCNANSKNSFMQDYNTYWINFNKLEDSINLVRPTSYQGNSRGLIKSLGFPDARIEDIKTNRKVYIDYVHRSTNGGKLLIDHSTNETYNLQSFYLSYYWWNECMDLNTQYWHTPVCMTFYNHFTSPKELQFVLHPGNTRYRFYDFKDFNLDMIIILPKDMTITDVPELLNIKKAAPYYQYLIDRKDAYFLKKQKGKVLDLSVQGILPINSKLFFSNDDIYQQFKKRENYIYNKRVEIVKEDGNIYIDGESIAYIDDNDVIRFYRKHHSKIQYVKNN